ncbi:CesT family type III secretion system chaperone [Acanthopleuribacter pedis]|uniref:Type III secretion system chaperone n=1 Tax=Acanthopleuribacter pedis TaxID=442870 RepID=A0A8J7U2X3_9BACT|nr:CesT family type III secretion system chaperone [Acanthopleuribacter pedis]MBO1317728.1 type III secretion system chaperone [Acanthopleuribacter pedis]
MSKETVNRWLVDLHDGLALDERGRCFFSYGSDDTLKLNVPSDGVSFFLSSVLVKGPLDQPVQHQALRLNLFQEKTRGGALAVDDKTGDLVLCFRQRIAECDFVLFRNIIANFAETVTAVRRELMEKAVRAERKNGAERGLPRHGVFC